jgi:hypothetical protein
MYHRRFLLFLLGLLALLGAHAQAQIKIDMRITRRLFIAYEPVIATVEISNLTGHDITLNDADGQKWFSFQVNTGDTPQEDRIIPPLDLNYHLQPLSIAAGQSVKRSLNIASLYGVQEFGTYHAKASVYSSELQRYFSSPTCEFEITEGKMIWQQTVGVPAGSEGAGGYRTISLLTHRRMEDNMLYIRVEDKEGGIVYTTNPLGRLLTSFEPQVEFDKDNKIHVLQLIGPKSYIYSKIGLNGEWLGQLSVNAIHSRPMLKRRADGVVVIAGGEIDKDVAPQNGAQDVPKLSDRPPGMATTTRQ